MKILCGFKGSGKSSVARACRQLWQISIGDIDALIEEKYRLEKGHKRSCREIALHEGEEAFRLRERQAVTAIIDGRYHLLDLGGGTLDDPDTLAKLKKRGQLIYVYTEPAVLWERIKATGVPSFLDRNDPKHSFKEWYDYRVAIYEAHADYMLPTRGQTPEALAHLLTAKTGHFFSQQGGLPHG